MLIYEAKSISKMILVSGPAEFDAIMRHLGLIKNSPTFQNPLEGPFPQQKHLRGQYETAGEEDAKLTSRISLSYPEDSFFSTLQWLDDTDSPQDASQIIKESSIQIISQQSGIKQSLGHAIHSSLSFLERTEDVDLHESLCGMHINVAEEKRDGDQYKINCERQPEFLGQNTSEILSARKNADLLGLVTDSHISCLFNPVQSVNSANDPTLSSTGVFPHIAQETSPCTRDSASSKPSVHFGDIVASEMKTDPFSEFLACTKDNAASMKSCSSEASAAMSNNQQQPNYSRAHFETLSFIGGSKSKNFEKAFDDLLTSQGFQTSTRTIKSLGEMKRQKEIEELDPVELKVKEWTKGKEKNIRALLGSMNNILWPNVENWTQPSIGDLLTSQQVRKYYHRACLVIHPDKQVGTENETLARAIFTELNDAWTAYENAGSPSF